MPATVDLGRRRGLRRLQGRRNYNCSKVTSYCNGQRGCRNSLLCRTIQEHKNKDDPDGYLESKLLVDYPGDAELMRVSIKGTYRDDLPVIVNAIVDSYMDEIVNGDQVARLKQRDLLDQHYHKNQEEYRTRSEKFAKK